MILKSFSAILILGSLLSASDALAHSGGLDAKGCHAGSRPYHCHRTTKGEKPARSTSKPRKTKPTGNRLEGSATVTDGDTIAIHGTKIRIAGIDALESSQRCGLPDGGSWACGRNSTIAMRNLVSRRNVSCDVIDTDRYGRAVATCRAGGIDIADELVRMGLALDYPRYSPSYREAESFARSNKLGMHLLGGRFVEPWKWRRGQR